MTPPPTTTTRATYKNQREGSAKAVHREPECIHPHRPGLVQAEHAQTVQARPVASILCLSRDQGSVEPDPDQLLVDHHHQSVRPGANRDRVADEVLAVLPDVDRVVWQI